MSRLPAKGRIALLDWVKAAAIVNMVLYHALYDAAFLFGASGAQEFMRSAFAHWWERGICGAFILVSARWRCTAAGPTAGHWWCSAPACLSPP